MPRGSYYYLQLKSKKMEVHGSGVLSLQWVVTEAIDLEVLQGLYSPASLSL